MRILYNGIELVATRTQHFDMEPEYDATGLDMLYQKVTISVLFMWNPVATASNKAAPQVGIQAWGTRGDRLGLTIPRLRQLLSSPRGNLIVTMGQDIIFNVPGQTTDKAVNVSYPCCPMGGPFPHAEITSVEGDYTAIGRFTVQFGVTDCQKIVLSHRWNSEAITDDTHFTTRYINGEASFNLALLAVPPGPNAPGFIVDQFRAAFSHSIPIGFNRSRVRVYITEDSKKLQYAIEDRERTWNLGTNSPLARLEGSCTAGVTWPYRTAKQALGSYASIAGNVGGVVTGGDSGSRWTEIKRLATNVWGQLVPDVQASAITRAIGRAGNPNNSPLSLLCAVAVQVCLDRLGNVLVNEGKLIGGKIVSCMITTGHDSDAAPYAEARIEAIALNANGLKAIKNPATSARFLLNLSPIIVGKGVARGEALATLGPYTITQSAAANPFPSMAQGMGGRARWIAQLVTQILTVGCNPPARAIDADYDPNDLPKNQTTTI